MFESEEDILQYSNAACLVIFHTFMLKYSVNIPYKAAGGLMYKFIITFFYKGLYPTNENVYFITPFQF